MQVGVSREAGMKEASGTVKRLSGMLVGTAFKGNAHSKATGTVVKRPKRK